MSETPALRPLATPLHLAALELADLAQLADNLQAMVARLAGRFDMVDPQLLLEGQAADLLSQRLAGVSAFLIGLAHAAPKEARVDVMAAVQDLTLSKQARRFSSLTLVGACEADDELLLFEC